MRLEFDEEAWDTETRVLTSLSTYVCEVETTGGDHFDIVLWGYDHINHAPVIVYYEVDKDSNPIGELKVIPYEEVKTLYVY